MHTFETLTINLIKIHVSIPMSCLEIQSFCTSFFIWFSFILSKCYIYFRIFWYCKIVFRLLLMVFIFPGFFSKIGGLFFNKDSRYKIDFLHSHQCQKYFRRFIEIVRALGVEKFESHWIKNLVYFIGCQFKILSSSLDE